MTSLLALSKPLDETARPAAYHEQRLQSRPEHLPAESIQVQEVKEQPAAPHCSLTDCGQLLFDRSWWEVVHQAFNNEHGAFGGVKTGAAEGLHEGDFGQVSTNILRPGVLQDTMQTW